MTAPVTLAEDRSLAVPAGHTVRTGYVPIHRVRMANRARMAVGDVDAAYRRQLQLGSAQRWPCPNGRWEGEDFVLLDGRHAYVSALMVGMEYLLVAWIEASATTGEIDV